MSVFKIRLNTKTVPVSEAEREEFRKVGGKMIEIQGDTEEEIINTAQDADALLLVEAKIKRILSIILKNVEL